MGGGWGGGRENASLNWSGNLYKSENVYSDNRRSENARSEKKTWTQTTRPVRQVENLVDLLCI